MIINHNITALNTYRQLNVNSNKQSASMEKLSSGLRINRAGDDAAGLAISEKMRGQIRGLDQANRNAQDGISMVNTAEGALNETHDILQRMRELATQAANDTNTTDDRNQIQNEVNQLTSEINRIGNTTEFNTQKLLKGSTSTNISDVTDVGSAFTGETVSATSTTLANGAHTIAVTYSAGGTTPATATSSQATGTSGNITINNASSFSGTTGTWTLATTDGSAFTLDKGDGSGPQSVTLTGSKLTTDGIELDASGITAAAGDSWTINVAASTTTSAGYTASLDGGTAVAVTSGAGSVTLTSGASTGGTATVDLGTFNFTTGSNNVTFNTDKDFKATLQIGANENQSLTVQFTDMRSNALGLTGTGTRFTSGAGVTDGTNNTLVENGLDVSNATNAANAITVIDNAINQVSTERAKMGAYTNRLEHTINNLGTSSENLTAAESRIRDVDMAKEMMNQSKSGILAQAAQAMLAQANQQPQQVLQLLRG